MADTGVDLLMKMVMKGSPIQGESTTEFDPAAPADSLRADFKPGSFVTLSDFHYSAGAVAASPDSGVMQPVHFSRTFDSASTLLFQALANCETLDSISVIKRKAAGSGNSGEVFLRLDFSQVLIIDLNWHDGEVVEETGAFIYRELKVQYRPQKADGSMGTIVPGTWKLKA